MGSRSTKESTKEKTEIETNKMSKVKMVKSAEEYNAAITGSGLGMS